MLDYRMVEDENDDWDLYWSDTTVPLNRIQKMQPYQRINHFPGMSALSHKHNLARNLKKMQKLYENMYDFFPKTWILPADSSDLKNHFNFKKSKTFIVKPVANCQGRGIYLTREFDKIKMNNGEQYVVQRYMHKPFLVDGLKFDMRIYVLVYGVDPLRLFVFREGIARFATDKYQAPFKGNMENMFMHLTNYAINKQSDHFEKNKNEEEMDSGHKRSVTSIFKMIAEKVDGITVEDLWVQIEDIAVKTLISA